MNESLSQTTFLSAAAFLTATTALTVLFVGALAHRRREHAARSPLWRTGLSTIALLVIGEGTGLFSAGGAWLRQFGERQADSPATAGQRTDSSSQLAVANFESTRAPIETTTTPSVLAERIEAQEIAAASVDADIEEALTAAIIALELSQEATASEQPVEPRSRPLSNLRNETTRREQATVALPWYMVAAQHAPRWAAWAWAGIAAMFLVRAVAARGIWCWRYRHARRVTDREIRHCAGAIARELRLRRRVEIWSSPRWVAPVAWGVWRPSIGLPADFQESFTRAEQDAMLAHELGHLAARDPAWQCLADAVTALLWWAPWCWWLRKQMRIAAEWMADEASLLVAEGPQALAECLVTLGRRMTPEPGASYAVTGSFRSNLGKRVARLLELAESGGDERKRSAAHRWLTPALVACVVFAVVAGSAWARSGIESTQGAENMRVFEQSWRRSLAGGIMSLALGAPTSAVLAQDEGGAPTVEVEVEVAVEEDEAEEAQEEAAEEADEAEEAQEEAAEESEGILEEITVEVEAAVEEAAGDLEGALEEVSVEIEETLADVDVELDEALAEVEVEVGELLAEAEIAVDVALDDDALDGASDDGDEVASDDEALEKIKAHQDEAAKQVAVAKEKAKEAIKARDKAILKMKHKMAEGLAKRLEKDEQAKAKMKSARDKMMMNMDKALEEARAKLAEAKERGDKNAPKLQEELERKLQAMRDHVVAQQARMEEELKRMNAELERAKVAAQEKLDAVQRDEEYRLVQRLSGLRHAEFQANETQVHADHLRQELEKLRRHLAEEGLPEEQRQAVEREADKIADELGRVHDWLANEQSKSKLQGVMKELVGRKRRDDEHAHARFVEAQARRKHAFDMLRHTAAQLRDRGQQDSADQIEEIAKMLADEALAEIKVEEVEVTEDQSHADVDQLRGEVSSLRGEIAELRDMLKQALRQNEDSPPKP